jgi:hypothetical protein
MRLPLQSLHYYYSIALFHHLKRVLTLYHLHLLLLLLRLLRKKKTKKK